MWLSESQFCTGYFLLCVLWKFKGSDAMKMKFEDYAPYM